MVCYGISGVVNFETASQGLGLRFSENRDVFQNKKFNMYAAIALRLLSKYINIVNKRLVQIQRQILCGTFLKAETDIKVTLLKAVVY